MIFSSIPFLFYFLPIFLIAYFVSPKKYKNGTLFFLSLIFYGWGEPVYIFLMLFSTVFDYINGLLLEKYERRENVRRLIVFVSITGNLLILGFFKYADFLVNNLNQIFSLEMAPLDLPLPIGISFYTFQTMSYIIDLYRRKVPVQRNIISFGAYVAMFPQLVAGPIVRYGAVSKELDDRKETIDEFSKGLSRFFAGLSKKVLIANNVGMLWTAVKETQTSELSIMLAWLGIIAFALQIYFDFSGYSDMAIGLGRMIGFKFPENFNYPYISRSVSEFWRRWHMTLGGWFRDYLYIPLGGNRGGKLRMFRNLIIVWFLTGLWHGASWNFVLWGLYYGALIILERLFLQNILEKLPKALAHSYMIVIFLVGWVFFELDTLPQIGAYLSLMFGLSGSPLIDAWFIYYIRSYGLIILLGSVIATGWPLKVLDSSVFSKHPNLKPVCGLLGLFACMIYLVDATYNPFLYFRF